MSPSGGCARSTAERIRAPRRRAVRLLVVYGRQTGRLRDGARGVFRRRLDHFHWIYEECTLDELIAGEAPVALVDAVAVVGGDGTLHKALTPSAPRPLLVVPAGSGNDFARALQIPDAMAAAERLRRGSRRLIDLGEVSCDGTCEPFANGVGVGLDGLIAERHAAGIPYALGAALSVPRLPRWTVKLRTDNSERTETILSLGIANGPYCGGGFRMAPHARLDDALLDLVIVRPIPPGDYLRWLPRARRGDHGNHPAVRMETVSRIEIESDEPLPLHVDGEPRRARRIAVEIRPAARAFYAGRPGA